MRWALKFPPGLLIFLEKSFEQMYKKSCLPRNMTLIGLVRNFINTFAVQRRFSYEQASSCSNC